MINSLDVKGLFPNEANKQALDGVAIFVHVVENGGFTAAANQLGNSTSFISKQVTGLESRLGVRLLNRTTRTISLTDVGRLYFERCKQIMVDAEEAERSIFQLHDNPQGVLKLSAPISFSHSHLNDILPDFLKAYPDIQMEIDLNDRFVDVVADGFDVVLRGGELTDSNLISRQILRSRAVVVASPEYLKKFGEPQAPSDLKDHDCIGYAYKKNPALWDFVGADGKRKFIKVRMRTISNNAELNESLTKAGMGFVFFQHLRVKGPLRMARLLRFLKGKWTEQLVSMPYIPIDSIYLQR